MKKYLSFSIAVFMVLLSRSQQRFKDIAPEHSARELNILRAALTSLHPGIYRYQSPAQVDSLFASMARLTRKPVSQDSYFILLSQALTHIHCGHTYANYWNQPKNVSDLIFSKSYLPFLFRMIGKKIIITHNLSESTLIKRGDEVLSINSISSERIVDSLVSVSPSDGLHGLTRKLNNISILPLDADTSNYDLFDIYFPLFFSKNFNTKCYTVRLKTPVGQIIEVSVKSVNKAERLNRYNKRYGELAVHEKNWLLRVLNKNTAYFRIGDFETWKWKKDYRKYLDNIFTLLRQRKICNLIVDIRGNSGGDDAARDEVFSYLTASPFGCSDTMRRRVRFLSISDTLLPFLKTWDKSFKEPKNPADFKPTEDGCYEKKTISSEGCRAAMPQKQRFIGRIFLIIDRRNESTTFTLAKLFRAYKAGEIVGEPTSGNQQGINGGQFFFLYLPYSNIEIDIPLVWGAYDGQRPDSGIMPDKLIPLTITSITQGQDPAITYILREIIKSR